ncbi:MAG: hypothetical protein IJN64_13190 [Lachnospiraceae bacterium]|nr:hypothetical protein [Lachnospiraceae bacterium]
MQSRYLEILEFTQFARVFRVNQTAEIGHRKEIFHEIKVSVVMELVRVGTYLMSQWMRGMS